MHGTIDTLFTVTRSPLAALGPMISQWRDLADRALTANVFYDPAFALAAAPVLGRDVIAFLIWSRRAPRRLCGLFPMRIERHRWGVPLPLLVGWTHPFAPLGVPLVDRNYSQKVIAAWLGYIGSEVSLPSAVLLPQLPLDCPLADVLAAVVERRGGRHVDLEPRVRALLAPAGARTEYLESAIGRKKQKELRRQRRRLEDDGPLRVVTAREPYTAARALETFLRLEAAGWKGRARTAARDDPAIATFVASAVIALVADGKARIDVLEAAGSPIAALITLRSGDSAWCWKIAYDEAHARYSPGVQLLIDATQALLADPQIARADSCATSHHPMIDHVWRERLPLADRLLSIGPAGPRFAAMHALEYTRRAAIASAKAAATS